MTEEWRDIQGYEGHYRVSNTGLVLSLARKVKRSRSGDQTKPEKILSHNVNCNGLGYAWVGLRLDGVRCHAVIHRLVAKAFIPNPAEFPQVNHKDGNKLNNHVGNLEWCTHQDNITHATGLKSYLTKCGEEHSSARLTWDLVNWIRAVHRPWTRKEFSTSWIAKKLGVSVPAVSQVVSYGSWKPEWVRLHGLDAQG